MTLEENVREVNSVLVAVKDKIVECGVEVADGTHAREYAPKVKAVYEAGKKTQYDEFWDNYFVSEENLGKYAGSGWNYKTFFPNRDIVIKNNGNYCFYANGLNAHLGQWCADLGINITIAPTSHTYMFSYAKFTGLPQIDFRNAANSNGTFYQSTKLVTIDKLILKSDGTDTFNSMFGGCNALENLTIEGVIGQSGLNLQWSTLLSKASITSIINALSTTTSGLSVTLSKTAVETAFGSTTATEWTTLISTRSNWTINLV